MLDEPTNHLDFPAVVWLEKYLIDYESTLIIVSHDRSFLDNVVDTIVELEDNELNYFKGSFGDYQNKKAEAHRRQEKLYKDYKEKRAHIQEFIDKFRSNPKRVTILRAHLYIPRSLFEQFLEGETSIASILVLTCILNGENRSLSHFIVN